MPSLSEPQPRSISKTRIFNRRKGVRFRTALTPTQWASGSQLSAFQKRLFLRRLAAEQSARHIGRGRRGWLSSEAIPVRRLSVTAKPQPPA
jgi:hypothetical protein